MMPIETPDNWLRHHPLSDGEQLFALFSSASAAKPLKAWQLSHGTQAPSPIWGDTPYAQWAEAMPYVVRVDAGSGFFDWVASTEARDWGWLFVSSATQEALVEQFRSLTKVLLPTGDEVFFRFWDGRYLLPILASDEVDAAELLPLVGRCLINGQAQGIGGRATHTTRQSPWWQVPPSLPARLGAQDPATHINNLITWLSEERPDLFEAFPEQVLRRKVARFVACGDVSGDAKQALADYLAQECDRSGCKP